MKVILLSGSPKASGNTRQALDECAKVLEDAGVEAEVISLHGTSIAACKAWYACKKTGRCAIEDDLNALALKVKEADGFIVGSPVYFGTARDVYKRQALSLVIHSIKALAPSILVSGFFSGLTAITE